MSEKLTPEQKDLKEREEKFDAGYKKLADETSIALQAIITPTGPVLQKVDIKQAKEEAKKQIEDEDKTAE